MVISDPILRLDIFSEGDEERVITPLYREVPSTHNRVSEGRERRVRDVV